MDAETARVKSEFAESLEANRKAARVLAGPVAEAARLIAASLKAGGKVLSCGNGGSAADAQHFASELLNRFETERISLAAMALTTDASTLTSIANDRDYREVFSRQPGPRGFRRCTCSPSIACAGCSTTPAATKALLDHAQLRRAPRAAGL